LGHLLETLQNQETKGLFIYSIVVVDNDYKESAKETISQAQTISSIPILYDVEPEQNISLARNKALKIAGGDFLAFIDDDEFADAKWLVHLYEAAIKYAADGVLGPVLPFYEIPPPTWVTKGAFFRRKSFPTGTLLKKEEFMRTGNFLISKKMIQENKD
jgi:succinoglycan biosynthesis protein ExoM